MSCYKTQTCFQSHPTNSIWFTHTHFLLQLVPTPTSGTKLGPTSLYISGREPVAWGPYMAPRAVSCGLCIKLRQELKVASLDIMAAAWPASYLTHHCISHRLLSLPSSLSTCFQNVPFAWSALLPPMLSVLQNPVVLPCFPWLILCVLGAIPACLWWEWSLWLGPRFASHLFLPQIILGF